MTAGRSSRHPEDDRREQILVAALLRTTTTTPGCAPEDDHYDPRRTFIGSTRVARCAGSQLASSATNTRSMITPPNASGSVVLTPNTSPLSKRVRNSAPTPPTAM